MKSAVFCSYCTAAALHRLLSVIPCAPRLNSPIRFVDEIRQESRVVSVLRELRQGGIKRLPVFVYRVASGRTDIGTKK